MIKKKKKAHKPEAAKIITALTPDMQRKFRRYMKDLNAGRLSGRQLAIAQVLKRIAALQVRALSLPEEAWGVLEQPATKGEV